MCLLGLGTVGLAPAASLPLGPAPTGPDLSGPPATSRDFHRVPAIRPGQAHPKDSSPKFLSAPTPWRGWEKRRGLEIAWQRRAEPGKGVAGQAQGQSPALPPSLAPGAALGQWTVQAWRSSLACRAGSPGRSRHKGRSESIPVPLTSCSPAQQKGLGSGSTSHGGRVTGGR